MKKTLLVMGAIMLSAAIVLVAGSVLVEQSIEEVPSPTTLPSTYDHAGREASTSKNEPKASGNKPDTAPESSGSTGAFGAVAAGITSFFGASAAVGEQGSTSVGTPPPATKPEYLNYSIRGTNISGLEFSGIFDANTEETYKYFKDKGFTTVRLPFKWDELQPYIYGDFDPTTKAYLDQNIAWAKKHGLKVILDAHNYGRRTIYRDGGFHDDFANSTQHTFILPYGDHDSANATLTFRDYGRGLAGTAANPASPADSYKVTFDGRINSTDGNIWDELFIDTYYKDENNRYSLVINPTTNSWVFSKRINGVATTLASGSKSWTLGQYYNFEVDLNQATPGKINVSVDGAPLFATDSVDSDPTLDSGYVSMFPSGVNATIKAFTLDVDGDTTSGGPEERRLTEDGLPLPAWEDFWTKLSQTYKNEPAVFGYDHNEPHDMPVPTTPQNYSYEAAAANGQPVATATAIGQSMVNAIRSTGDNKFVIIEMDHWANTHRFADQYGADPKPWIQDPHSPQRVVYSGHYYFDNDHSGIYAGSPPPSSETITAELTPFFSWCKTKQIPCYIGEFGVPNTPEWQPALSQFLQLTKQYDIWWTQWAGGDLYSSVTTLQPTNSFTVDRLQMTTIHDFLNQ